MGTGSPVFRGKADDTDHALHSLWVGGRRSLVLGSGFSCVTNPSFGLSLPAAERTCERIRRASPVLTPSHIFVLPPTFLQKYSELRTGADDPSFLWGHTGPLYTPRPRRNTWPTAVTIQIFFLPPTTAARLHVLPLKMG